MNLIIIAAIGNYSCPYKLMLTQFIEAEASSVVSEQVYSWGSPEE